MPAVGVHEMMDALAGAEHRDEGAEDPNDPGWTDNDAEERAAIAEEPEPTRFRVALWDFGGTWKRKWHSHGDDDLNRARQGCQGFAGWLRDKFNRTNGGYVAVCLDSKTNWRKEKWAGYKAHREKRDAGEIGQMERLIEWLRAEPGFIVLSAEGFEGDDICATVASKFSAMGHEIMVVSADKDLLSCLQYPGTTVFNDAKDETIGVELFRERYGIEPHQMAEWLALCGDKSDGIPGVEKVGPKTATSLLNKFDTLDGVIRAAKSLTEPLWKTRKALHDNLLARIDSPECNLVMCAVLASLRIDVPVEIDIDALRKKENEVIVPDPTPSEISNEPTPSDVGRAVEFTVTPAPGFKASIDEGRTWVGNPADEPSRVKAEIMPVDWAQSLEPTTSEEARTAAKWAATSRLSGTDSAEQAWLKIMQGREMGIGVASSLRNLHVVKGKITLSAHLMSALVLRSGRAEYFEPSEVTTKSATYVTKRKGGKREHSITYTWEDAERADLTGKANWKKHPKQMLQARAMAEAARLIYPDVVETMYIEEELS